MPILQQYLFAIGCFQGLLMASLLIFSAQASHASRVLGVWCLFLALRFLGPFITMQGTLNPFSSLIGWHFFLPASFGAFLYLYCRHALIDRAFKPADLMLFLPLVLCYLLNLDILIQPAEVKLKLVLNGPQAGIGLILSQIILYAQAFVYLGMSVSLIYKYQQQAKQTLSSFNPEIFQWLWKLLLLNFLIWSIKMVTLISDDVYLLLMISDALIIVLIYSIAMAQWRNASLFKINQLSIKGLEPKKLKLDKTMPANKTTSLQSSSGALDESIRTSLLKTVRQHMLEQNVYLDNQLTLTSLAESVGISTHHLSEVLNQQEGKNFYHFVNEYRIEHICEQLEIDKKAKILDLALSSGFSSKSTFNAVFRQFRGVTPSEYRHRLISN